MKESMFSAAENTGLDKSVVVAMSGGVDSSAAALLLAEHGFSVVGVSMQVYDYRGSGGAASRATCCAPADFDDARAVASAGNFPYYVFDFEEAFAASVIWPFVAEYLAGRTPNPCLECNRKIKFAELRQRARALGVQTIATGHYARIRRLADACYGLFAARDESKDQSYFLYNLSQSDLAATMFPVGEMKKGEVRDYLRKRGMTVAEKKESYDICFVSGSVAEFIENQTKRISPGEIVEKNGKYLGSHDGYYQFTVGQRRGLGVSGKEPLYVLKVDAENAKVYVGAKNELKREYFDLSDVHWISGQKPEKTFEALVKLRYRSPGVRCRIMPDETGGRARVHFLDDWTSVSPGQAAVFYDLDCGEENFRQVFGGGIITSD